MAADARINCNSSQLSASISTIVSSISAYRTRLYRYYASMDLIRNRPTGDASSPVRLPAGLVEDAVVGEIRRMIRAPKSSARTMKLLRDESPHIDEKAVVTALGEFDQLWAALYPAEQTRLKAEISVRMTAEGLPNKELRDRAALEIRGRAASLYQSGHWSSAIEHGMAQADHEKLQPLLEEIADLISPETKGKAAGHGSF